jgi:hypothetical protein
VVVVAGGGLGASFSDFLQAVAVSAEDRASAPRRNLVFITIGAA